MKLSIGLAAVAFSFLLVGSGCSKDKCEEAKDVLKDCGAPVTSDSDKCDEKEQKQAQCIIDNKDEACKLFKGDVTAAGNASSPLNQCLSNVK